MKYQLPFFATIAILLLQLNCTFAQSENVIFKLKLGKKISFQIVKKTDTIQNIIVPSNSDRIQPLRIAKDENSPTENSGSKGSEESDKVNINYSKTKALPAINDGIANSNNDHPVQDERIEIINTMAANSKSRVLDETSSETEVLIPSSENLISTPILNEEPAPVPNIISKETNTEIAFEHKSLNALDTIHLSKKQDVLNGKAFFNFPSSSFDAGSVSGNADKNEITKILLSIGDMQLSFVAQDLHAVGGSNLLAETNKYYSSSFRFTRKNLLNKGTFCSVLSTPTVFDTAHNAILVNSLMVKNSDNSLFVIDAFVNKDAYKFRDQFKTFSENVFKTMTAGTRISKPMERTETYSISGTNKKFSFSLPANYFVTTEINYDNEIFTIEKYSSISDTSFEKINIYVGYYPSLLCSDYEFKENTLPKVKGMFLNKNVDWLTYDVKSRHLVVKEQKIPCDNISTDMMVHISMMSNKAELIGELSKIVEGIKLNQ